MAPDLFARLEEFYDAVPRGRTRVEEFGELVLFVPREPGFPFYARPRLGGGTPTAADVEAVRARQRELGLPESFEWVRDTTPGFLPVAEEAGLAVLRAPLMVLDPAQPPEAPAVEARVRFLDADDPSVPDDLATYRAVAHIGFGAPGTAPGDAGTAERDAARVPSPPEQIVSDVALMRQGRFVVALAETDDHGALAAGAYQRVGAVAEVVGIATLPAARRRGLGAAVTASLVTHALDAGVDLLFLSAGDEDIARVYGRLGFARVGTACIAEPAG